MVYTPGLLKKKDVLNMTYQPGEQEVRRCLTMMFNDMYNIHYGEECWLDKDKEDYVKGEKEGNIADMIFTDEQIHDLTALELKGRYLPRKKSLEQLKTYRKFVDRTFLVCSHTDFDRKFIDQCKKLGVGIVSLTINTKTILESKHDALTKFTKSHLIKLRKSSFFALLRKFGYKIKDSDLYWPAWEKYAPFLMKVVDRAKLIDEWKKQWCQQIMTVKNVFLSERENKDLIYHGDGMSAWFSENGEYILSTPGHNLILDSPVDMKKNLEAMKNNIDEILKRLKPMEPTLKSWDDRLL